MTGTRSPPRTALVLERPVIGVLHTSGAFEVINASQVASVAIRGARRLGTGAACAAAA
jgi:hypothetical protein